MCGARTGRHPAGGRLNGGTLPRCSGLSAQRCRTPIARFAKPSRSDADRGIVCVHRDPDSAVDHTEHRESYKRMVELAQGYEGYYAVVFTSINADVGGLGVFEMKGMTASCLSARAALSQREIPTGPESQLSIGRTMNRSWPLPETPNI